MSIHIPGGATGGGTVLVHTNSTPSVAATLNTLNAFAAVGDPVFRQIVDLRNATKVRMLGSIASALVAETAIQVQYHIGGDPSVLSADAGWATLITSAGSHALNALFYSAEATVPAEARINHCLIRCGVFSGNGLVSPTITCCALNFYA